jgi:2-C-methyl-D-erythritol 4-phosphate cytidylyltransferase
METAVLVLAAGRGERLGGTTPKGLVRLRGRTLLERSVRAMLAVEAVGLVQPVVPDAVLAAGTDLGLPEDARVACAIPGGAERQDSVAEGLRALPASVQWVAVHDAARCLVSPRDVARVIDAARAGGAALLAVPASDTIKRVRDGRVVETPPRAECWAAQTPQVFRAELLREAIAKARADGIVGTDDAQLVERLGVPVRVVEGSRSNLKITRPEDLLLAERLLAEDGVDEGAA